MVLEEWYFEGSIFFYKGHGENFFLYGETQEEIIRIIDLAL